jgi:hypothetical protein
VPRRPAFFLDHALPFLLPLTADPVLEVRHGAVAALAELLPALSSAHAQLPAALQAAAADVIPAIERGRLARGKGGEVMRPAICRLAETTAAAGLPLAEEQRACLLGQLKDNLRHSSPDIQAAAGRALAAFAVRYLRDAAAEAQQQLVQHFMAALGEAGNPAARRGGALALGALPRWLLELQQGAVLAALAAATTVEPAAEERDAEARVNAVGALARAELTLLGQPHDREGAAEHDGALGSADGARGSGSASREPAALSADQVRQASEAVVVPLLAALDDYSVDNR